MEKKFWGFPECAMVPKPTGEALPQASIRFRDYGDGRVDRIKVEVWMKIRMFRQTLCEEVCLLHINVL